MNSKVPVAIYEQTTSRYDVADIAGSAPAIAGGVAGGMAASGLGAVPGMAVAGLGAAGGAAMDEIVKNVQGDQVKTPSEVASKLGQEFVASAGGEGVGRGLMAAGKLAISPHGSRMTPAKRELAKSAIDQGFKVRAGTLTDAPILGRWEGMIRQIFGDRYESINRNAAITGAARLRDAAGKEVAPDVAGEAVIKSISRQRVRFSEVMGKRYAEIDDLLKGEPIVPTAAIKKQAEDLLAVLPPKKDGGVVGETAKALNEVLELTDNVTVRQAQRLRTMFREAADRSDILPGVAEHDLNLLKKSVDEAFNQAKQSSVGDAAVSDVRTQAINKLRSADQAYAKGISQFDKPIVKAITKDASVATVDPDQVVRYIVKPKRLVSLQRVKKLVSKGQWKKVKAAHADDLMQSLVKGTDDPLVSVFDGKGFRDTLNRYGREVLEEVHGKEWVDAAYKYANALMLAEKTMKMSGGIVAANIALHPVRNLPKLMLLRAMAHAAEQPGTFKYLTEGFRAGPGTELFAAELTRFATQLATHAKDKTGGSAVTITEPQQVGQ